MSGKKIFQTPYLRFDVPADLTKINKIRQDMAFAWLKKHPVAATAAAVHGDIHGIAIPDKPLDPLHPIDLNTAVAAGKLDLAGKLRNAGATAVDIKSAPGKVDRITVASASPTASAAPQATASLISLSPSGLVQMGFNCAKSFDASASWPAEVPSEWLLQFAPSPSGPWIDSYYLGAGHLEGEDPFYYDSMSFPMDRTSYGNQAYAGTRSFRVVWRVYVSNGAATGWAPYYSDVVTLDFSAPSCNDVHAVRFVVDGTDVGADCTLVGSHNDHEPTLIVTLEYPARPGGEVVRVVSNNKNLGWFVGATKDHIDIEIPANTMSGAISWFLGTAKISKFTGSDSFHLHCHVINPDGSRKDAFANAGITLTHK